MRRNGLGVAPCPGRRRSSATIRRDGRIRTGDLGDPNAARCQTAPHPGGPIVVALRQPSGVPARPPTPAERRVARGCYKGSVHDLHEKHARSAVTAVELNAVTRLFGANPALVRADVRVAPGEVLVLRGPNGAGKTTLLRIMATALSPTYGHGSVLGFDLGSDGTQRHILHASASATRFVATPT